jgi:hypothetical protein
MTGLAPSRSAATEAAGATGSASVSRCPIGTSGPVSSTHTSRDHSGRGMCLLSSTEGRRFTMVATTDGSAFRYIRLFVDAPGRSEEIAMTPALEDAALRAQIFPADPFLRELADAVAASEQRDGRPVSIVRVEAWRVGCHGSPRQGTEQRVRSYTLYVAPPIVAERP